MTNEYQAGTAPINTRTAWRPILRPISRLLIAAQLALVLQPLSAMTRDAATPAFNPVADAQMQRLAQLNQTIEQGKAARAAKDKSPADQVSDKLAQSQELVAQLRRNGTPDKVNKGQQLKALLAQIKDGVADVRADFAATRADLQRKNLPASILQRHDEAVAQFEQRSSRFTDIAGKADDNERVQALADFFDQYPTKRKAMPLGKKLPWSTPEPNKRAPAETQTAWFRNLYADQKVQVAQAGSNIGPLQFNIPPEPGRAPTLADLAETDEVQLSAGIRAKATELGNSPVNIYNWVRNNVEWTPTAGAIQSAQDTLDKKRGNATDTASLVIALLRAANIPARYQYGTIDVDAQEAQNWVGGATVPQAVLQILSQGGIAARGIASGGRITTIRMEHVWVQAYVNWTPSRGSRHGGWALNPPQHVNPNANLNRWIPIDSSFKQYSYTAGMDLKTAVPLDANALLTAARQGATVNEAQGWVQNLNQAAIQSQLTDYQGRLKAYIDSTATGANSTVGDVIGKKIIPARNPALLAGVEPNLVVMQGSRVAAVPGAQQHKFTYRLYASQTDQANESPMLSFTEKTSKLVGKRLTLTYVPATQADADVIASYLPKPHADGSPIQPSELPTSLPGYLINLRAQINLDGQVVAQGNQAMKMGADLYSTGGFTQLYDTSQWDLASEETNTVGNTTAIGISAGGVSLNQIQSASQRLQTAQLIVQAVPPQINGGFGEQIAGDVLSSGIWSWFLIGDRQIRVMQQQFSVVQTSTLAYGLFHIVANAEYVWGVVRKVSFPGTNLDIGHYRYAVASRSEDQALLLLFKRIYGLFLSGLEAAVPEQLFLDPAQCNVDSSIAISANLQRCPRGVSATSGLAIANAQGQPVYTITQDVFARDPNIVDTQLSAQSQDLRQRIQVALQSGFEVTVNARPINQGSWSGGAAILVDPATGDGGYLISGGSNGGFLDWWSNNGTHVGLGLGFLSLVAAVFAAQVGLPVILLLFFFSLFASFLNTLIFKLQGLENGCPSMGTLGIALEVFSLIAGFFGAAGVALGNFVSLLAGGAIGSAAPACRR